MSTRCHIVVKEKAFANTYIYHHCDGYPDGVGSELVEALKTYTGPWNAPSITEFIEDIDDQYEVDSGIHGDEDYIYEISCDDMTLKCYNADYYDDQGNCHGGEIAIPGNIDFSASKNADILANKKYPKTYFDTFTKIVCAMIIHPNPNHNNYTDLVNAAKLVTDKMFESILK